MKEKIVKIACVFMMVATLSACSFSQDAYDNDGIYDPLEPYNRVMLDINDALDQAVLEPAAQLYRSFVPRPARQGIRNFLRNLEAPAVFANEVLQGDVEGAAAAFTRFGANTVLGFGGIVDIASDMGVKYEHEDFGQTLAAWGVGDGMYIVLPLFGSSTLRDTAGFAVDVYTDPVNYAIRQGEHEELIYYRSGVDIIDTREAYLDLIKDLRMNSLDYYASLRSVYYQRRNAMIRDMDPDHGSAAIPDYDETDD